jgi:hypothetical protein
MIHQRRLTLKEVGRLIEEAPDVETRNLKERLESERIDAYRFFDRYGIDHFGLVSGERPIYMAVLTEDENKTYHFWTVVNKDVREQFSLFKMAKRELEKWVEKYRTIYATMENTPEMKKNRKWAERLGFFPLYENKDDVTLMIC